MSRAKFVVVVGAVRECNDVDEVASVMAEMKDAEGDFPVVIAGSIVSVKHTVVIEKPTAKRGRKPKDAATPPKRKALGNGGVAVLTAPKSPAA